MEYLGPNRRGKPGRSYRGKPRRVSHTSSRVSEREKLLWDNSERFLEDVVSEEDEFVSLDLESAPGPVHKHFESQDDSFDEQSLYFIRQAESALRDLSPEEISREILHPASSNLSSFSKGVHLLDLEFDFSKDLNTKKEKEEVSEYDSTTDTRDVNLLSSASSEAFDAWFEKLNLK